MTQKELADASGVAKITIQQYQPRLEQLMMIAKALKVKADVLMGVKPLPSQTEIFGLGSEYERAITLDEDTLNRSTSFAFWKS